MFLSSSLQHTTATQRVRLWSRALVMQNHVNNGIARDGVCAQLCPSVLLPAEVTGASVADASMTNVSMPTASISDVFGARIANLSTSSISSARSILSQNYCGRRMQAPYGAFFVANYLGASTYFDGFYYAKDYIS